ncbi:MAG: phosphonoacetaldehyde reductase [Bacteroidales bacterium]|jgi:alcohol dehydrogenase class IV|nr:phosphonoacetaldehyde reductase [Bacteroidales bacterium]
MQENTFHVNHDATQSVDNNTYMGRGCIKKLSGLLKNSKKILIFTGKNVFKSIQKHFENIPRSCEILYYNDFSPNPKKTDVDVALKNIGSDYDTIVAVGGGSVIDFAKLYKYYKKTNAALIAIPTTAGTGSEVTRFAVCYINNKKYSIEDDTILPDFVIIDPDTLDNSPKYLRLCTATDALIQSVESYWSINSMTESKNFARQSMILCKENINQYVIANDPFCAEKMALAAYLSGKAINITKTTAAHALSYAFTIRYKIPHGHAVALSIAGLFEANQKIDKTNCNDKRGVEYVRDTLSEIENILGRDYFNNLFLEMSLETNLAKLGIISVEDLIKEVNLDRLKNNPRYFSKEELKDLFQFNDDVANSHIPTMQF